MDITKQLEEFVSQKCSCGKDHQIPLPKIIVKSGAVFELPFLLKDYGVKKAQIIADVNTYNVAGKKVCEILG